MQELAKYQGILSGLDLTDEEICQLVTILRALSGSVLDEQFKIHRQGGDLLSRVQQQTN